MTKKSAATESRKLPAKKAAASGATAGLGGWQHLERLVMALQHKLGKDAEVRRGEVVKGRKSKTDRKIDVSVRGKIGSAAVFVAIDCAHLRHNVNVMKVGVSHAQFEDVGASRGIIVTSKGYGPGAIELAASYGIDTCIMRRATKVDLAGRTRAASLQVRIESVGFDACVVTLANGTKKRFGPDDREDLLTETGDRGSLVDNIIRNLLNAPTAEWASKEVHVSLPPTPLFLQTAKGRAEVRSLVILGARRTVDKAEEDVVVQPGDWVFERVTPSGTEPEPTFFNFRELDAVAADDDVLREVCATTPCPVHKRFAKAVRTKWSHNTNGERVAVIEIEPPCCEQQDHAVTAAMEVAFRGRMERAAENALQFAQDVIARSKASTKNRTPTDGAASIPAIQRGPRKRTPALQRRRRDA